MINSSPPVSPTRPMMKLSVALRKCLVVGEIAPTGRFSKSTLQTISAAQKLSFQACSVFVVSDGKQKFFPPPGVDQIITGFPFSGFPLSESLAGTIAQLARSFDFTHIFAPNSSTMKDAIPRSAGLLGVQPLTDISSIISDDTFTRPIYAGNAIETIRLLEKIKLCTVRVTSFDVAQEGDTDESTRKAIDLEISDPTRSAQFVGEESRGSEKPQLGSATRIVTGGRGLKTKQQFAAVLEPLCEKLGAALGATRAVVDAGFCPNDLQVGQTGKIVAPELYVAVGVSGAIQHIAGMKESKVIVAINSDPEAPIFKVADYGLVGDCLTLVPELTRKI